MTRTQRAAVVLLLAGLSLSSALAQVKKAAKPVKSAPPAVAPIAVPAPPQHPPPPPPIPPPELVRELGGISEYRLANGLQLLLIPDESKPVMTVNLTYRVGSRHEGPGETGMAHLLEHLLFKGTPEYADITGEFSRRGMRFNGTTTIDRTNYFSSFNASDENLAFALTLEANRMLRSNILQSDLDTEMSVVRNELEIGENNPAQLMRQRVLSLAYRFHPYGRPTIGARSDIEHVPISHLQAFYRQHYQPDNATLIIAGQIDRERSLALVAQAFGPLPRPTRQLAGIYTVEPAQDGDRTVNLRRVGGGAFLMAAYHVPGMAHPDCAPLVVLGNLLSQPPGGLLYKTLVETKLASQVFAGGCGGYDPGVFSVGATLAPGADLREVEKQLFETVETRARSEFKPDEVQRVAARFELSYRQVLKSPETAVGLISEAVAAGDWRLIFKTLENVRSVTPADVARVARTYLQPTNRNLGRYLPVREAQNVEVPLVAERSAGLDGLTMDLLMSAGESFDSSPAALAARTQALTLPSGIKLALLPKQNRGDAVSLQMQLHWAELRAVASVRGAAFVDQLLLEGTSRLSREAIGDEATRLRAGFNLRGNPQGALITVTAEKDTLLPTLALLQELLLNPRFPAEAFERAKARALAGLGPNTQDPETLRQEALRRHYNTQRGLSAGDPAYQSDRAERASVVRATELADVSAFYRQYWSANQAEVAVVGTLPEGLAAEIDRLFGGWKKPEAPAFVRWIEPYQAIAPLRIDVQARDKANAILHMRQELRLNSLSDDYIALSLANQILGGGLDSRLARRVRQQEGLSYGLGTSLTADRWGEAAALILRANFAPENRERVLAAVHEEIARALADGFTQAELDHARTEQLQARQRARGEDGALGQALLSQLVSGEDWAAAERGDQRRRDASLSQVNAALRKYLLPDAWVTSTAGDFGAKPQTSPK